MTTLQQPGYRTNGDSHVTNALAEPMLPRYPRVNEVFEHLEQYDLVHAEVLNALEETITRRVLDVVHHAHKGKQGPWQYELVRQFLTPGWLRH